MARSNVFIFQNTLEISFHLAFAADGALRLSTRPPALGKDERSIAMTLKVPMLLFKTPTLSATVSIRADDAPKVEINTEAAAAALSQLFGANVDVRVVSEGGAA